MLEIRVPASTSNLGPGFDCLGIAFRLYNTFRIEPNQTGVVIAGCPPELVNDDNPFLIGMRACCQAHGLPIPSCRVQFDCQIPIARGLGSSSACLLGGMVAANALAGADLDRDQLLRLAAAIEGHPDNVAPALLGGMVVAAVDSGRVHCCRIPVPANLRFAALIPEFTLLTTAARKALPQHIPLADGIFNVSRAALMVAAFATGEVEHLSAACEDRFHQPYRARLIDGYESIVTRCRELGCLAAFLSGGGPTIMTITLANDRGVLAALGDHLRGLSGGWRVVELAVETEGVRVATVAG